MHRRGATFANMFAGQGTGRNCATPKLTYSFYPKTIVGIVATWTRPRSQGINLMVLGTVGPGYQTEATQLRRRVGYFTSGRYTIFQAVSTVMAVEFLGCH